LAAIRRASSLVSNFAADLRAVRLTEEKQRWLAVAMSMGAKILWWTGRTQMFSSAAPNVNCFGR
jgi:hypothetical protein